MLLSILYMITLVILVSIGIILVISLIDSFNREVFGATEQECIKYRSNHLIKLSYWNFGQCDWLIDKFLYNGSGYKLNGYSCTPTGYGQSSIEVWVLTK